MNQSEFEANTRNQRQARENACEQVTIGFGFTSNWLIKWREIFLVYHKWKSAPMQNHRNSEITFDTQLKITL